MATPAGAMASCTANSNHPERERNQTMREKMRPKGRSVLIAGLFAGLLVPVLAAQNSPPPATQPAATDVVKELDAMRKRIEQLEAELKNQKAQEAPVKAAEAPAAPVETVTVDANNTATTPVLPAIFPGKFAVRPVATVI